MVLDRAIVITDNIQNVDALLLVGGKGTRLQAVVNDRPKPMAQVNGKPFVEWLIHSLRLQGIRRFILCTGHMGGLIQEYFGDGKQFGIEIEYSLESSPLGTGGAIRNALSLIHSPNCLILNGDSYCRFNAQHLLHQHLLLNAGASLWLTQVDDCSRYGSVTIANNGAVQAFIEKSAVPRSGLISAGVYLIQRQLIATWASDQAISIEKEIFPALIGNGLYGVTGEFANESVFIDIGTPESYQASSVVLQQELTLIQKAITQEQQTVYQQRASQHLIESAAVMQATAQQCAKSMVDAAELLIEAFRNGNKLLLCGNGGSAADAQHVAAEFVSRLTKDFERPGLPAIALTTDTSFITAFANDCGFDGLFERQVKALGKAGDILIGISTSGNSRNVVLAVEAAKELGMKSIALMGDGGILSGMADVAIVVPSRDTQFVQESLLSVEHVLCDLTERALFR